MKDNNGIKIAIVGGDEFTAEVLKTTVSYYSETKKLNAVIHAVAWPDSNSPGIKMAKSLGRKVFSSFKDLYNPKEQIDVIVVLDNSPVIFYDILNTRPKHIRIVSYKVFRLFWDALKAETKRYKSKLEQLHTIIHGIDENILIISPNMEVEEVNDVCLNRMGYKREEVIGKKCYEFFQKSNRKCYFDDLVCPVKTALKTKKSCKRIMPRVNKYGKVVYLEISIYPIFDENNNLIHFVEISRDVTEPIHQHDTIYSQLEQLLEKTREELRQRERELRHQDKMASLGKLAASVVHEINNPISGILNLVLFMKRIIKEGIDREKDIKLFEKNLNLMETEIRRISRITSNLLTFSKGNKTEFSKVNVNDIINDVLFLCSNMLKINKVKVEKKLSPNLPTIVADGEQLKQVFINLISNAVEAMEEQKEKEIYIKTEEKEHFVHIYFGDKGPGIPDDIREKIFEPFYTTKKKGKGVGLGLSVVYGIVKNHSGYIEAKDFNGNGALFVIKLPITQAEEKYE